jgi:hypothetical protein
MPSSVIADIKYIPRTGTLRITFVSGVIYDYKNVPEEIYHALKTSYSKGSYLNRSIKKQYAFERVK